MAFTARKKQFVFRNDNSKNSRSDDVDAFKSSCRIEFLLAVLGKMRAWHVNEKKRKVAFYWENTLGKVSWQDIWHLLSDNIICTVSITVWNFFQSSVLCSDEQTLLDSGNTCVIELLKFDWRYYCAGNSDRKEKTHVVPFPSLSSTVGR